MLDRGCQNHRHSRAIPNILRYDAKAMMKTTTIALVIASVTTALAQFVDTAAKPHVGRANDPAAVEVFRDRGLGLFIHWGVDGTLEGVISHSLVGASLTSFNASSKHFRATSIPIDTSPTTGRALPSSRVFGT
jgi:hypothetical protein